MHNAEQVERLCPANEMDSHGSVSSTTQGPLAGRMVKTAVVQQRDRHHALKQTDDDDPYGDPQSSRLPVWRWRTQIRADTAANATLTLSAHRIRATSEGKARFDLWILLQQKRKKRKHKGLSKACSYQRDYTFYLFIITS